MNKNIILVLTSVASLIIGYNFYPMMNSLQVNDLNSDKMMFIENRETKETTDAVIKPNILLNKPQKVAINKSQLNKNEEKNNKKNSENELLLTEENIENSELIFELNQWSKTHKVKLNDIIDNNVDAKVVEPFKKLVFSDNAFHNDGNIYQSAFDDEKWAYKLDEEIRYAITQHKYALDIELLNLECKQLVCELLIKEIMRGSWIPIYVDLFPHLRSKGFIAHTDGVNKAC